MTAVEPMTACEIEVLDKAIRQVEDSIRHYENVAKVLEFQDLAEIVPAMCGTRDILRGMRDSGTWVWTEEK